jgi:hypothetical protein
MKKRGSKEDYHTEDCLALSKHRTSHPSGNVGEILSEASIPMLSGTDGFCMDMGYAASTPCLGAGPALGPRSTVICLFVQMSHVSAARMKLIWIP